MGKFKVIKELGAEEPIVSMIQFKGDVLMATSKRVFKVVDDKFIPLDIAEYEESKE